jgi:AGCS family alanine or glycine:cation symporter
MGSAPIVAAAAKTRNPVRQALVSSTGTFWDTVVICALTGLVLVNTGVWQSGQKGAPLTAMAFERLGSIGPIVLTICLLLFVFSTIIGWSYYGERALEYLAGVKSLMPFRIAWVALVFIGAITELHVVWNFADTANALMAIPNLIALLLLSGVVVKETRRWLWSGSIDEADPELKG